MAYNLQTLDVVEARIITFNPTAPAQVGINTIHYQVTTTVGAGCTQFQMASALDTIAAPLMKLLLSSTVQYRGVTVQKVFPLPRVVAESATGFTGTGSGAATQVSPQVAGLISVRTGLAGRQFRGRLYAPFLGTGSIGANGSPTAPYVTALQNFANAMFANFTAGGVGNTATMTPVIYHPRGYGDPPLHKNEVTAVTNVTASTLAATIRRRGNFGRSNPTSPI